jgi:pyruvate kinase
LFVHCNISGETAAGKYPIESLYAMRSILYEADEIVDNLPYNTRDTNYSTTKTLTTRKGQCSIASVEDELEAVAASSARSAKEMNAKLIILITMSGRVARAVARQGPTVPVLAFCTDAQVARRLQLHRCVMPLMLQSSLDPGSVSTRMGHLRAEAVRTAKELGFVKNGDRIIMVDRTVGKAGDLHQYAHNMKVVTVTDSK